MVLVRTFLFIGLCLIALSSAWIGTDDAVHLAADAPFECETCTGVEAAPSVLLDARTALIHFLDAAGDASDPFVAAAPDGRLPAARPALSTAIFTLQQPEPAWVPLRPPRFA